MPFSESGLSPDVIINPNAFPSRMTIGMLVESMAGKAGALHGLFQVIAPVNVVLRCQLAHHRAMLSLSGRQDGSPFQFDEQNRAVDYFGHMLRAAGYNYYGNEVMYSGITGVEFKVDIYLGVVYYQRLRHMVSDKSQVRATGPINSITRQPIKVRDCGGLDFDTCV